MINKNLLLFGITVIPIFAVFVYEFNKLFTTKKSNMNKIANGYGVYSSSRTPLDELIDEIIGQMKPEDKEWFRKESKDHPGASLHFGPGMAMRNNLHLWEHKTPLTKWFCEQEIFHGDDRSGTIYKALWCRLNNKTLDMKREAEFYKNHWAKCGILYSQDNPNGAEIV